MQYRHKTLRRTFFGETGRKLEQCFYSVKSVDFANTWTEKTLVTIPNTPALRYINFRPLAPPDGDLLVPIEVAKPDKRQVIMIGRFSSSHEPFHSPVWCANDNSGKLSFRDPPLARLPKGRLFMLS